MYQRPRRGQALTEWSVVIAIVAIAAIIGLSLLSGGAGRLFSTISSQIALMTGAGDAGHSGGGASPSPDLNPTPIPTPCAFNDAFGRTTPASSGWGAGPCGVVYGNLYPSPANSDASVTPGDAYWKVWNQNGGGARFSIPFPASFPSPTYHYAYQITGTYSNAFGSATSICFPEVCLELNGESPAHDAVAVSGLPLSPSPLDYGIPFSMRVEIDPGNSIAVWLWPGGSRPVSPTFLVADQNLSGATSWDMSSYGAADYSIINLSDLQWTVLDGGPPGPTATPIPSPSSVPTS